MRPLIFFLLFSSAALHAKTNLTGHWKEVGRQTASGDRVEFADTMRIHFLVGNEYTWSRPMGFIYRGTYKLTEKSLDMGARFYTVMRMASDRMVLSDKDGTYEFTRYEDRSHQTDNTSASSTDRQQRSSTDGRAPRDIDVLKGRWEVFKRTASSTQASIDYTRQIKALEVKENAGGTQALLYSATDPQTTPSWYIERYKDGVLYCKGKDARQIRIIQFEDGELILEEGDVTYFLKKFKG